MPINSARNLAFGLGLGLNYNVVYTNLQFTDDMEATTFVSSDVINQWSSVDAEIPLEFRWRSSTPYELPILAHICWGGWILLSVS